MLSTRLLCACSRCWRRGWGVWSGTPISRALPAPVSSTQRAENLGQGERRVLTQSPPGEGPWEQSLARTGVSWAGTCAPGGGNPTDQEGQASDEGCVTRDARAEEAARVSGVGGGELEILSVWTGAPASSFIIQPHSPPPSTAFLRQLRLPVTMEKPPPRDSA